MGPGPSLSVAVIGHVNHGKTALVRALTGIETDRLAEEKARGLSITLGYAWRDYPDGAVDFLDAPGHEDFIRAMVMGTTGARAALLVVSATEGFGRQTREHLRVAELLGLRAGIVAISKSDLLGDDAAAAVRARIAAEVEGTFLAGAPMIACSARTGAGLAALHEALAALVARRPEPEPAPGAILPLDRVFTMAGAGTVVTGTLHGGPLRTGAPAMLMPSGVRVTLRQLQVHGAAVEGAAPGGRVAAALRGVTLDEVRAGDILCTPDALAPSLLVDVQLELAAESARPVRSGDEVRVMWGARQDLAKVRLLADGALAPGGRGLAQLRFTSPVAAFAGQRAVLRRPSPAETIGGAVVLDPVAPRLRGDAGARGELLEAAAAGDLERIAELLARRGGGVLSTSEAARLSRRPAAEVRALLGPFRELAPDLLASPAVIDATRESYRSRLAEAHRAAPDRAWAQVAAIRAGFGRTTSRDLLDHVERQLVRDGDIRLNGARVALASHDPLARLSTTALARLRQLEGQIREGGASPPDLAVLAPPGSEDAALVELLIDLDRLARLRNHALRQTLVFHVAALDEALARLRAAFPPPAAFPTGAAREALGTSRKFIVPILEFLDARGDTVREGDVRRIVEFRESASGRHGTQPSVAPWR
ncbi:MAG: selenocysteine-specific translation elongation factor [Phenylobacterium sp.]|uniref:selenocysteine-specific translation elongation factor n=1 Tax=Phenylobacterium sp. TaxID=1871053 RepID=UPI001A56D22E|nr:selenocysteine-specific translation elongation factor [Phenylobacterium sp.]MBL8771547.1 selenocysteine-specific translation elongation factor [Phenylobacterium sp.]